MAIIFGKKSSYLAGKAWGAMAVFSLLLIPAALMAVLGPYLVKFGYPGLLVSIAAMLVILSFIGRRKITVERWVSGIEGEAQIAGVLEKLPADYAVFRGIKVGERLDVDFTVVGPTGVFAIEAKSHKGRIGFDGQTLTRNGRRFKKDFLRQVTAEASGVRNIIRHGAKIDLYVAAVVVFSNSRASVPFGGQTVKGCHVFARGILNEALEAGSGTVLGYGQILEISKVLAALTTDAAQKDKLIKLQQALQNG